MIEQEIYHPYPITFMIGNLDIEKNCDHNSVSPVWLQQQ